MTPEMIPVNAIATAPQIRTRNGMDPVSLRQLAESIRTLGVLQPIIVRPHPAPVGAARYLAVAGHRRLAALKMIGADLAPAVVAHDDDSTTLTKQIAENVQRENLTLADTADAVRQLANMGKKPAEICKIVNKSAPWVSKHLSLTKPGFSQTVRQLLEADATGDIDLILTLDQIEKHPNGADIARRLIAGAMEGTTTRAKARAALDALKTADNGQNDGAGDENGKTEGDSGSDAHDNATRPNRTSFPITLNVTSLIWLREELRRADAEPCVQRTAFLKLLDAYYSQAMPAKSNPAKENNGQLAMLDETAEG